MIAQIREAALNEFRVLWQDKRSLVVLIATPLLFISLFGYLYVNNVVTGVKTLILDQDNTSLSRSIADSFGNSDRFRIVGYVNSQDDIRNWLEAGRADAAVVIPRHFYKDIKKLRSSEIMVIVNGSNMIIANTVMSFANEIIQTFSAGTAVKIMEGKGFMPDTAYKVASAISFRPRIWYNPTLNYTNFLLLGLLGTAVQQVVMLYSSIAVVRERQAGRLTAAGQGLGQLAGYVAGRGLPYFLISFININLVLVLVTTVFKVPFRGSVTGLFLLEAAFLAGVTALGIFLSIACRSQLEATQMAMLVAVPSFLISGYTWPLQAMPLPLQALSKLLPLSYFVNSLRDLAIMGVGLDRIWRSLLYLTGLAVILWPAGIVLLKIKLEKDSRFVEPKPPGV